LAKKQKDNKKVKCITCKYAIEIQSGDTICTTKYKGEEITDYPHVDELTEVECLFYKEKNVKDSR
jgi:hypothetical protein